VLERMEERNDFYQKIREEFEKMGVETPVLHR